MEIDGIEIAVSTRSSDAERLYYALNSGSADGNWSLSRRTPCVRPGQFSFPLEEIVISVVSGVFAAMVWDVLNGIFTVKEQSEETLPSDGVAGPLMSSQTPKIGKVRIVCRIGEQQVEAEFDLASLPDELPPPPTTADEKSPWKIK